MEMTPASLAVGLVVSAIGCGLFLYGRKQTRAPQLVAGLLLLALPMCGLGPWWVAGGGAACIAGTWLAVRAGL